MTLQDDILAIIPNAYDLPHVENTIHFLRDAIYRHTAYVDADNGYGPSDNWTLHAEMFNRAVRTEEGFACGGRALLFLTMLQELGIEARYAGMWSNVNPHDVAGSRSHASVDVRIGDRWIASDPHFNVAFIDPVTRGSLSWPEIHQRVISGLPVQITTEGYVQDHFLNNEHLASEYPVEELAIHMALGPSFSNATPQILGSWDGNLHFQSGSVFSIETMLNAPHYQLIAVPPTT